MDSLFCALVGVKGNAFPVRIDEFFLVGELKDAIKAKKQNTIRCDADELQLFLAKKGGAWLETGSDDVKKLKKGEKTTIVEELIREENELLGELDLEEVFEELPELTPKQIHVLVVVPPCDKMPATGKVASTKKQLQYKEMSTEASCRKFLDALAQKLANLYDFEIVHYCPTIEDVFCAIDKKEWGFRLNNRKQLTNTPLPNFFSDDEWLALRELNMRTNRRIYDGVVPKTNTGNPYIILPHDLFRGDKVEKLRNIAVRGDIVFAPTEMDVKDEVEFSSSSSGRSDDT